MKSHLFALLTALCLSSVSAHAGLYSSFGLGASFNDGAMTKDGIRSSYDNSPAYSFAVGYKLPLLLTDVRAEGEYLRMRPDTSAHGSSSVDAFMANGYANVPLVPFIDPYVGVGVGLARFQHKTSPAYQMMLGADYELPFMPATIGAEYRYFRISEDGGSRGENAKLHSNILMLKFRYEF